MKRRTLATAFALDGVALHRGGVARVEVKPADAGEGLTCVRVDLPGQAGFVVGADSIRGASYATTLGPPPPSEATVSTTEHLLAALYAAGIDDARIEVDGPELPILGGDARAFSAAIARVGISLHGEKRPTIVIDRRIEWVDGERRIEVVPDAVFSIDVGINFDHPAIGQQRIELQHVTQQSFARELAPARTFAFLREVEWLREQGLAAGGTLQNTIVLDETGVINEGGLRFDDEFVRHKALDLVGDLALLGAPLRGRVRARRAGHAVHQRLVQAVLAAPDAWHWLDGESPPTRSHSSRPGPGHSHGREPSP